MEGNLRGARESLVVSPTFSATRNSMDISQHISATRERDRRLYSGMGPIPPRTYSQRSSQLAIPAHTSPNAAHSRGLSETAVPFPFKSSYLTRSGSNKRASSAIGHTSGPWSQEGHKQGRFPIKESRSHDVLREPRPTMTAAPDRDVAATSSSRASRRSPSALETLPEDEHGARFPRSASAASDLRDHVNDLKGRISSLKLKAQEDHLRRRSLQNLRAPSPFTSAKSWQSGAYASPSAVSPFTANTGLGIKAEYSGRTTPSSSGNYSRPRTSTTTSSQREGEELVSYDVEEHYQLSNAHVPSEHYTHNPARISNIPETPEVGLDASGTDEEDFMSADEDDFAPTGESVYEDAVYEFVPTERHEDRIDAFDYENFFLHSAMGTYSMEDRRSSTSSGSSNATTRPVTALQTMDEVASEPGKRISFHARNTSSASVSTIASFATAAEELEQDDDDDDEANEQMDQFSQHLLSHQPPMTSRPATQPSLSALRTDSAINMRRGGGGGGAAGSSPTPTALSRGSSSSSTTPTDLAHGLQTSKIFSILTEASREEARLALSEEETQLIYGLAASLTSVCSQLQVHTTTPHAEAFDRRKAWRRRLDEARRVLNGEEDLQLF